MFFIQSERLDIVPLSLSQLILLQQDRDKLNAAMHLLPGSFEYNSPYDFAVMFSEALNSHIIPLVRANPEYFHWYTHWLVILRENRKVVGGLGISGLPNEKGEVSIGYFTEKNAEGLGYASETVRHMVNWIFKNPWVEKILADTLTDGYASQKVLIRSGFNLTGPCEDGLRWQCLRI